VRGAVEAGFARRNAGASNRAFECQHRSVTVARVLPNVTGLDKEFDYRVPESIADPSIGDLVRVDLHGRRVGGWVVALDPPDALSVAELKPIAKVSGRGPAADLIDLAEWAAIRWAGRRRHFLQAASPDRAVVRIPRDQRTGRVVEPRSPASTRILEGGGGVLRLPPTSDPRPAVMSAVALGPTLVVVPAVDRAMLVAAALRRAGLTVAVTPNDWAIAAGGADVVIGGRRAAWAPCPALAAVVVVDEHDEALQDEGSPTWHARDVLIERTQRAGVPLLLTSPCPTLTALEWGPLTRPSHERERKGWPIVEVIDRSDEEPWKRSMVTPQLIRHLRDTARTVVCVHNTPGRSRLLACRQCRSLARCERCDAAVALDDAQQLTCGRCGTTRPPVCLVCGAGRFANLRPGVSRLREEIEAAAGRPAALLTGAAEQQRTAGVSVFVGTEAALHRVERADTVAFLDFDRELLAPRYRAAEQAMALLARAARLVGVRSRGGRILVQTLLPEHVVLQAAERADPGRLVEQERPARKALGLPPFGAYAAISGNGSDEFVASLPRVDGVLVARVGDGFVARGPEWMVLGEVLRQGERRPGSRLRVAVDPPR
jgi:primosomal protein N' (replication factor Y)